MQTPSTQEAMDAILAHPDADKKIYWAKMMVMALDRQLSQGRITKEKREEYLALLKPILSPR